MSSAEKSILHQNKTFNNINYIEKQVKIREFFNCEFISCDFTKSDLSYNDFVDTAF